MVVHVEASTDHVSEDARKASAVELSHHIKSVVGVTVRIDVRDPQELARSEGKAKRVVDNRPKI